MSDEPDDNGSDLDEGEIAGGNIDWAGFLDPNYPVPGEVIPGMFGYRRVSEADYRRFPAVNASLLKYTTAAEMYTALTSPQRSTDALSFGTLLDVALLTTKESWRERFAVVDIPINPTTGKGYASGKKYQAAWDEARAANPEKVVMTADKIAEYLAPKTGLLEKCLEAVKAHPDAYEEVQACEFQASAIVWHPRWECWVKTKVDLLRKLPHPKRGRYLCDLKSTSRHPSQFSKDAWQFAYFVQAAWYAHVDEVLTESVLGKNAPACTSFDFLVVSKEDPKKNRPTLCRTYSCPIDPVTNKGIEAAWKTLGLPEGTGRVDVFLNAVREHISLAPAPDDTRLLRRIWGGYEQEFGERQTRALLVG